MIRIARFSLSVCSIVLLLDFLNSRVFANAIPAERPKTMVFNRVAEPREKAFTILIPRGWQTDGGI